LFQPFNPAADVREVAQFARVREGCRVTRELNVLALIKGDQRFIFVYDDDSRDALIDDIRDKAADPATPVSWFDAAVLMERVRAAVVAPQEEF
jgi:hypothetical protein